MNVRGNGYIRGKYIFGGIGHLGVGHWCEWAPKQMDIWEKGYSQYPNIPVPISPQMFANGQWGKWALEKNGHLRERGTLSALKGYLKCPGPITPKCSQMGTKANGHLEKMNIWGKEVPQVP